LFIIGAGLIIVAVINGYAEGFLTHQFMRNVGRVSYSVYLLQLPAIYVSAIIIGHFFEPGLLATTIAAAIILPTILLIANIGYALFESPSIQLGRELGRRLKLVRGANIQANQ
jgi:peptidoglycan/LPS O-acetylase OafA/YrhL